LSRWNYRGPWRQQEIVIELRRGATLVKVSWPVAAAVILSAVYEEGFLHFSYGFRRGRGSHDRWTRLAVGVKSRNLNWTVDADICSFFDEIDHDWMLRFLQHRGCCH